MNTKRILALVLALLMVFSLTACGGEPEEIIEEEVQIEYVSGEQTGNNQQTGSNQQTGNNQQTGSNQQTGNKQPTGNNQQTGTNNAGLKGTTVRFATWKNPEYNEDGIVVESFKEKTGINVQVDLIGEGEYTKKISGMVAAATAKNPDVPDIFFCTNTFPACLKVLQPIDAMKLDLNDPIWDKTFSEYFTINGKTYLVNTVSCIWNETDLLFYNKKVLQQAGYADPDKYIQTLVDQGKWNFDALTTMMQAVKGLGVSFTPAFMDTNAIIGSTGANWLKFSNGKFEQGFDSLLYDATKRLSTWKQAGLVTTKFDDMGTFFTNDKMGFAITNAWGLKTTGFFGGIIGKKMDPNNIGFTYIPDMDASHKTVATGLPRGYGLIKGAPNPEGAGVFLRYYLDVNNYDLASAFISQKASDFFFKVTTPERFSKQNFYVLAGLGIDGVAWQCHSFADSTPDQVEPVMKAAIPQLKNIADQLNKNIQTAIS
ncbi:MAG: extracellular solute-binding protein [Clostridia bacterium]|nr:extracellular solute-binding protein [Clostridia bacterium]